MKRCMKSSVTKSQLSIIDKQRIFIKRNAASTYWSSNAISSNYVARTLNKGMRSLLFWTYSPRHSIWTIPIDFYKFYFTQHFSAPRNSQNELFSMTHIARLSDVFSVRRSLYFDSKVSTSLKKVSL